MMTMIMLGLMAGFDGRWDGFEFAADGSFLHHNAYPMTFFSDGTGFGLGDRKLKAFKMDNATWYGRQTGGGCDSQMHCSFMSNSSLFCWYICEEDMGESGKSTGYFFIGNKA